MAARSQEQPIHPRNQVSVVRSFSALQGGATNAVSLPPFGMSSSLAPRTLGPLAGRAMSSATLQLIASVSSRKVIALIGEAADHSGFRCSSPCLIFARQIPQRMCRRGTRVERIGPWKDGLVIPLAENPMTEPELAYPSRDVYANSLLRLPAGGFDPPTPGDVLHADHRSPQPHPKKAAISPAIVVAYPAPYQ